MVEQARQPDGAAARVLPRPASSRRLGPLSRTASAGAIRQPAQQSLSPGRPASALAGGSASGVRWELPTAPTQPAPPRPAEGAAAVRPASSSGSMARAAAAPLASSSAASYAGRPGTAVSSLGSASSIGGASFSEVQPAKVVFTAEQRQRKPAPAAASLPGRPATAGTRADDAALALLPTAADAQLDVAQRAPLDPFACTLPFYREETPLEAARAPFDSLAFKRELSEHVLAQVGEVCHAALGSLRAEVTEHLRGLQKLQGAASAVIADVQTASKVVLDTATAAARTSGADAALPLACSGGRADGEGHGGSGSFPARGGPHATGHAELSELLQAVAACQAALDGFEVRQVTRETEAPCGTLATPRPGASLRHPRRRCGHSRPRSPPPPRSSSRSSGGTRTPWASCRACCRRSRGTCPRCSSRYGCRARGSPISSTSWRRSARPRRQKSWCRCSGSCALEERKLLADHAAGQHRRSRLSAPVCHRRRTSRLCWRRFGAPARSW
ncbi:unnamed protein product [Prorocentrum cordatum]|uniref:C2H2-type domain-containing protein n=1 Tax=Prorocentrum cordatum TaxID=2364126 RepID=A0ABN9UGM4_9DINO|nr:unnamed protein product [Polarella glacialis]